MDGARGGCPGSAPTADPPPPLPQRIVEARPPPTQQQQQQQGENARKRRRTEPPPPARPLQRLARPLMSQRSSSSAASRGSQQSHAVFSNPATAPPSLPSSPRSSRLLEYQRSPLPSMPSPSVPSPEVSTDSFGNSSTSLVGQLLSTSGPVTGAASTPYGLIVSARGKVGQSCLGRQVERRTNGQHSDKMPPGDAQDNMYSAPEMAVPELPGYTDWRPVYAIV